MRSFFLFLLLPVYCFSQNALPSIDQKTKDFKKFEGFLSFYWDESAGKIWLEIDKPDQEILYVTSLPAGIGSNDLGLDRGLLGGEKIVKFVRTGRKVLLTQPNYNYRALSNDAAERRAVEQSFAQSVIWGFAVEAESNNRILVDATDFLMRDAMQVVNRLKSNQQGNFVLDKSRSVIYLPRTKNFPLNTEFESTVTFTSNDPNIGNYVSTVTPTPDAITVRIHHSFVQLPDSDYKPRVFDPRSSYYNISFYDYSSPVSEPISKYYIARHRLKKKDPSSAVSEAVEPIIYYLDNGTPEPIRSALMEGASWWNQAFEAAGYKNAFQVKLLPEDADPMDVRYNVINWVHRSTRGWSYGASVMDPRTGEIIKGHVTLGSLRVRQDYLIATGLIAPFENGTPADDKMLKMALDRLKQLSAHEVGHTLGLMHNYASSVSNRASVMDYPHPLAVLNAAGDIDISNAYDLKIGDWDKVSITYGYKEFPAGTNETFELDKILKDAAAKGLQFISDQDARRPGGMHPQAHLWDNGNNAVTELQSMMKVRSKALNDFGIKNIRPGMPMAMLEDVLVPVYFYHRYQLEAVSKLVGGMYYTYALRGDGQPITRALSKDEQRRALMALVETLDPKALQLPNSIIDMIPPRPAGYAFSRELFRKRTGLSFDALSPAETAADLTLSFLFNSERLNRLAINEASNTGLGISEMLQTLIDKTWKASRLNGIQKMIQMQTEQVLLTYLLSSSVNDNNSFGTKAVLKKKLDDLKTYFETQVKFSMDEITKGHYLLALDRMKVPAEAKATLHKEVPPGAPIGDPPTP